MAQKEHNHKWSERTMTELRRILSDRYIYKHSPLIKLRDQLVEMENMYAVRSMEIKIEYESPPPRCQCAKCGRFVGCIYENDNRVPCTKCDPDGEKFIGGTQRINTCARCRGVIEDERRMAAMLW